MKKYSNDDCNGKLYCTYAKRGKLLLINTLMLTSKFDYSTTEKCIICHQIDVDRRDGIRLNFWLSTGTVGSYLDHPRQGKTQLFRRQISMSDASEIFNNPRQHTGKGYHTKKQQSAETGKKRKAGSQGVYMRRCASCGASKPNDQFSNNQRRKGASSKCKACA